jgi:hypothetical protein
VFLGPCSSSPTILSELAGGAAGAPSGSGAPIGVSKIHCPIGADALYLGAVGDKTEDEQAAVNRR